MSRFFEQLLAPSPASASTPDQASNTGTAAAPSQDYSGDKNLESGEGAATGEASVRANGQPAPANSAHGGQNAAKTTNEQDTSLGPRRYSLQTEDSCDKLAQCAQGSGRRRAQIKVLYSRAIGVDKTVQTLPSNVDPSSSEQTTKLYSQEGMFINSVMCLE